MRWIDNQVGNLICSALAMKKRVLKTTPKPPSEIRRICVMKFFGMGSIVVSSASLVALRDAFPNAEIHFVTFASNKDILDILGLTDKQWYVDASSPASFAASTLAVANGLRAANIDLAIDFEFFAKFPLVLSAMAGIPDQAGFHLTPERWRQTLLDHPGTYNHYFHTKDIFLSLVYLIRSGDPYYLEFEEFRSRYAYPTIAPRELDITKARAKLASVGHDPKRRLIVLNPNAGADLAPEVRRWPADRYAELARRLVSETEDATVVLVGAKSEAMFVNQIHALAHHPQVVDASGKLTLHELLATLSLADLFVTNDSGPMHLGCLVNVPTVGLFFADTPTLFAPLHTRATSIVPKLYSIPMFTVYNGKDLFSGKPAGTVHNIPSQTISVDSVFEQARAMLGARDREPNSADRHLSH